MDFPDFPIAGLPASAVIIALVEGAKRLGLPPRYAPALAVVLGVAYTLLQFVVSGKPAWRGAFDAVNAGIVLGLVAAGVYSGTKTSIRRVPS